MGVKNRRADAAGDELVVLRARLDRLVVIRQHGGLTAREQAEYDELTQRERRLLAVLHDDLRNGS
jgi:hypothetical protein